MMEKRREAERMKAAVFEEKGDLRIVELPRPVPGKGEVLVQVMACGVCGTDVHIYHGDEGAAKTPAGTVLGHEFAGIVVEVGPGAEGVSVGDRVCVDPNKLCGCCPQCLGGKGHFCENMVGIGTTVHGGFAQYCAVPASQVHEIAEGTTYEMAAMTEPLACCLHGIDMCGIVPGDTVSVIGGGMIGQLMVQLSRLSGAARVTLIEPVESKRQQALTLGADVCIDPLTEDMAAAGGANVVIECVGKPATMAQAIAIAGQKATVMLFGLTAPAEELTVRPFEMFKKELTIKTSYINPYTQSRALSLIDAGRVDVTSCVAACRPLEDLPQVLADPALRRDGKVIICPWMEG